MKICSIVGTRPNFIKLAPMSKEIIDKGHNELIIHTGQHYDDLMSDVFFKDMHIPSPQYNLNIKETLHGAQIGKMIVGIESILIKEKPNIVLIYGDTNSTFAGALSAVKLNIPVAHIEAGCRSYDMKMPEEQNRVMIDHISNFLYAPTDNSSGILWEEDVFGDIFNYGDVSVDVINSVPKTPPISKSKYILFTLHRPSNTDSPKKMNEILSALNTCNYEVIFPVHPRTNITLEKYDFKSKYSNINYIKPLNYSAMINYMRYAKIIITDSGGVQKESYLLKTPCITLRDSTEWAETVLSKWNKLVPTITRQWITDAIETCTPPSVYVDYFGSPGVSKRILKSIEECILQVN